MNLEQIKNKNVKKIDSEFNKTDKIDKGIKQLEQRLSTTTMTGN